MVNFSAQSLPEGPCIAMITVGWREWVALPELGILRIKAKVDTGARSSALDVETLQPFIRNGENWVRFELADRKKIVKSATVAEMPVEDQREVRDSGGNVQTRYVISTTMLIGNDKRTIELTLARRPKMRFPMLIGRTAIRGDYLVDPKKSYLTGKPTPDIGS